MIWPVESLGAICDVLDSKRKPITKSDREPGPYPYYGATGILDYVKEYIFEEKLILLGEDGAKWGPGENSAFIAEGKYWVNNHAHVFRPHRDRVTDSWLVYHLNYSDLMPFVSGLTVPKLNQGQMREIPIPVPPLPEQQRIVGKLDAACAALAEAQAHVERNRANARELSESYLNGVFEGKGDGWMEKRLGDVATQISTGPFGTMLHKADYVKNGIPLVNPVNIVNSRIVPSDRMMVNTKTRDRLSRYVLRKGDVVIARRGELGRCALVSEVEEGWMCGTGSFFMRLSKEVDPEFFVLVFGSHLFKEKLQELSVGTTMSSLNINILEGLELPLPPIKEQRALLDRFSALRKSLDELETTYQQKLTELAGLKKAVLGAAFRGEF